MAASATEMSCTAVTITTGMSGYFSFVRSKRPIPSRSAIIRSESMSSNSSPEVSTESASMPEPACLQAYPAVPSIEATISRIASSSSTTRIRSGIGIHESLLAIVTHPRDAESNHPGPETPSRKPRSVIFKTQEFVRPELDERLSLVYLECDCKAGPLPAYSGGARLAHSAGRFRARSVCGSRELSQDLDRGLGRPGGIPPCRTFSRGKDSSTVRSRSGAGGLHAGCRITRRRRSAIHAQPRLDSAPRGDHARARRICGGSTSVVARFASFAFRPGSELSHCFADCFGRAASCAPRAMGTFGMARGAVPALVASAMVSIHRSHPGSGVPGCRTRARREHAVGCLRPGTHPVAKAASHAGAYPKHGQRTTVWQRGSVGGGGIASPYTRQGGMVPSARRWAPGRYPRGWYFLRLPA